MISDIIKFWSFLLVLIPSVLCCLFILCHLLFNRTLRHGLNNHVIIVLLFICLIADVTIYPWMLYYFQYRDVWERSMMFCVTWGYLDWSLYVVHTILFAWATIERHILIFHDGWLSTRKKRFFVHYLPLISLVLCYFIFYGVIYFFPPCENHFTPSFLLCVFPCLYDDYTFSMFDFLTDQIVPILTIAIFSNGLLVRVLWQKRRMRRTIHWVKHRKMIIQPLSISFLYLVILLPYAVVYILCNIYGISTTLVSEFSTYTVFFSYFIILLFPFVCALSLPELRTKMQNIFYLRRQGRRIAPTTITVRTGGNDRI